jgi:hypothetical protein
MRKPIEFTSAGRQIVVTRNDAHPDYYLWISIDGARFFLGSIEKGIETRREVKALAVRWLKDHDAKTASRGRSHGRATSDD